MRRIPSASFPGTRKTVAKAGGVGGIAGAFAILAPLVRDYLKTRVFTQPVDLADTVVLRRLAENDAQRIIIGAFQNAIRALSIRERAGRPSPNTPSASRRLRRSHGLEGPLMLPRRCSTSHQSTTPLKHGLPSSSTELPDVTAFAKLTLNSRFALEYISSTGALRYYYPDFVARLIDDTFLIIETKGLEDVEVTLKDRRARRWCSDATRLSGREWAYAKVPQNLFDAYSGGTVEGLRRMLATGGSQEGLL